MDKMCLIHHFVERSAELYPDKIAMVHEQRREPYRSLNEDANRVAAWLTDHGLKTGDRIILLMHNSYEYIAYYYGILKAGGVVVSLSTDIKQRSLADIYCEVEPFALLSGERFNELIKDTLESPRSPSYLLTTKTPDNVTDKTFIYDWNVLNQYNGKEQLETSIAQDDLAAIIFTSGSTGKPKGVMLTHGNIVSNTQSICQYLHLTENDKQMVVLPFFYVMGKSLLNTHMAVGASVVLNNKFAFTGAVVKQMAEEKVTGFSGVPSTYAYLLHRSPLAEYKDRLPFLRYCSQAGGHMSMQIKEKLREILPAHTDIVIMYGATEAAARLTYLDPNRFKDKINSIGKAIPGVTMNVLDREGHELPAGEHGELVAIGPNIMKGYWNDKENTDRVITRHGYHTGDLGYRDEEGFYYLLGRSDSLIKVSGHRINPQDVEDAIMSTGLVIEVAVVGIPDELQGNSLVAVAVVVNTETTADDIASATSRKIEKYKVPSRIILVKVLPKNSSGKIDRTMCRKIID